MKISTMQIDADRFDATTLDEAEQEFVLGIVGLIGNQLAALALTQGVIPATQAAGASVARMIKANLEAGIKPATLADVRQLKIEGIDG